MKEKRYFYEMDSKILNILSIVLFIIVSLITYLIIWLCNINIELDFFTFTLALLLSLPYSMFHEVLHSIGYVLNGANFKYITYGIHLEKSIMCCSCKQEISRKNILWSLVYPLIFIGIITYVIGLIFNLQILLLLSIINIAGCIGDIIMFMDFLTIKKFRFFEYDNPMAFGIITDENMENRKLFGIKRIEEKEVIQTVDKKVTVSKSSIIIILFFVVICLINMIL